MCRMYHGAVPSSVPAGLADGYRHRLQRSPHRQRVVDQEAEAWLAVGRLPAAGWPIIGPVAAVPLIMGVLSMNARIWG